MKKLGSVVFFLVLVVFLTVFVSFTRFSNAPFLQQSWWSFCSVILAVSFVLLFCVSTWISLEVFHNKRGNKDKLPDIPTDKRDVHLTRLDHVDREVTRYRDLVWKIAGFA